MLPVVVRIENLETKSSIQHVFHRSPVHIGRNKLNELSLSHGFVSLWHGILRFDENSLEYLDLDSTNGTEVDGHRVRRNVFVPVSGQSDLRIGSLRLHLSRSEAVAAEPKIDLGPPGQQTGPALPQKDLQSPASQTTGVTEIKPTAGRNAVPPVIAGSTPDEQSPEAVAGSLFLLYENYRRAWNTLHTQLTGKLAPLSNEKRSATLRLLRQRFPALEQEPQFWELREATGVNGSPTLAQPQVIRSEGATPEMRDDGGGLPQFDSLSATFVQPPEPMPWGASPTRITQVRVQGAPPASFPAPDQVDASSLLRRFAQTYAPESAEPRSADDVRRFLQQLGAVLDAFGEAFLELRRGHDQFGKEIAVPVMGDQTPLRKAKTPRNVLAYLLHYNGPGSDRIRSLKDGFQDVMIHHVAILNGIRQGITALLTYLSPDELRRSSALSRNGAGAILLRVRPVRAMALWRPYVDRHQELLQDEKAVQSVVFGSEFAFAYAQIVGGNVKSPPSKTDRTKGREGRRGDG